MPGDGSLAWWTPLENFAQLRLNITLFEFDVMQKARIEIQVADALPRRKTEGTDTTKLDDDLPEMMA